MGQTPAPTSRPRRNLVPWIAFGRSLFAIALGIGLLIYPEKSSQILGNFIGGFWIATGILSIRWGFADHRSKWLTLVMGAVAVVAGALAYSRNILSHWVPEGTIMALLAVVAILTGLLHFIGQLPASRVHERSTPRSQAILGIFEIGLGIVILRHRQTEMYWVMAAWALLGGFIILGDALYMRRMDKRQSEEPAQAGEVQGNM